MPGNANDEIVFVGKVTASITHEIKNVLASIKELTGLMDDLVSMADEFPLKDKFQNLLPRILNQVERGAELTKNFNTFSHVPDLEINTIDLGAVVEHIVYLGQRFARQKNILLIVSESNTSVEIETKPLQLYMGLFYTIEFLLNSMNDNGSIKIGTERQDEKIKINVICEGEITDREKLYMEMQSSDEWNTVQSFMHSLGSKVEYSEPENCFSVLLQSHVYHESS
jgi:nitrogen fixation/metabolism regulation signal transduction histidine kinase